MTTANMPRIVYNRAIPLKHHGDCSLLGVAPQDRHIFSEEVYEDGEDTWMARHIHRYDGTEIDSEDEDSGRNTALRPLAPPPHAIRSQIGWHTQSLNFHGPRHRGMREEERVSDLVRPISVMAKMRLAAHLKLQIPPPHILGLAESYVLAEIELVRPRHYLVCRRLRLAYALPEIQQDDTSMTYNYDTHVFHLLHFFDRELMDIETPIETALEGLPGPTLRRPLDCLMHDDTLIVADGGETDRQSTLHLWHVEYT